MSLIFSVNHLLPPLITLIKLTKI